MLDLLDLLLLLHLLLLLELLDLLGLLHGKGHGRGQGNLEVLSVRGLGEGSVNKNRCRLLELWRLELSTLSCDLFIQAMIRKDQWLETCKSHIFNIMAMKDKAATLVRAHYIPAAWAARPWKSVALGYELPSEAAAEAAAVVDAGPAAAAVIATAAAAAGNAVAAAVAAAAVVVAVEGRAGVGCIVVVAAAAAAVGGIAGQVALADIGRHHTDADAQPH